MQMSVLKVQIPRNNVVQRIILEDVGGVSNSYESPIFLLQNESLYFVDIALDQQLLTFSQILLFKS